MWQFNTAFLLQATVVVALCCLPMAIDKQEGFVGTAYATPLLLACFAAWRVPLRGQFAFELKKLSDATIEIRSGGGRQTQWGWRGRIVSAGSLLVPLTGFPALNVIDPEPVGFWLPVALTCAIAAVGLLGSSQKRTVNTQERLLVTDHLLFGRYCWRRRRWQVSEGDYLEVLIARQSQVEGLPEMRYRHTLHVCRPNGRRVRRQVVVTGMSPSDKVTVDLEVGANLLPVAERVAELIDLPYVGCRESNRYAWQRWWP